MPELHLTIIAKEPRPGRVKTRLTPPCTREEAAEIATAALIDTMDAVDAVADRYGSRRVLLFEGQPDAWTRPGWEVVAQTGGGLGCRLSAAFDVLGPGLIIGMDTPHAARDLGHGLSALRRGHDAIGLTHDGGYWVIGLHRVDGNLFDAVPMSTSRTGVAQLRVLHEAGRPVERLRFARDIDSYDDVRAVASDDDGAPHLIDVARRICARHGDSTVWDRPAPFDHAQRIPSVAS